MEHKIYVIDTSACLTDAQCTAPLNRGDSPGVPSRSTLLCDPPDSVPYTEALALSRASQRGSKLGTSGSAFQSDSTDQAARLSELEQECEKYKLEVIDAALLFEKARRS